MRYSIVMPYMKRDWHLHNTLISYYFHYKMRKDVEIVIVEDIKNYQDKEEHKKLDRIFDNFKDKLKIKLVYSKFHDCYNPAPLFNLAVENSCGEYLVITNPEVFHKVNILSGADQVFSKDPDAYLVCSCLNGINIPHYIKEFHDFTYTPQVYYQHSQKRNALFHFCSLIKRNTYDKIGGFDERFSGGIAFDDDDFRDTIIRNKIKILISDPLLTVHQHHEDAFKIPDYEKRWKRNQLLHFLKVQNKTDSQIEEILKIAED